MALARLHPEWQNTNLVNQTFFIRWADGNGLETPASSPPCASGMQFYTSSHHSHDYAHGIHNPGDG